MAVAFYIAAGVALVATALVITRSDAVHAVLYLIVSLLAVAVAFLTLGAPFAAVLEVIVYAGAIMVLFVFVVMMLGGVPGTRTPGRRTWIGPAILALVLLLEVAWVLSPLAARPPPVVSGSVDAATVGATLFGPYLVAVQVAGMLLLVALVGAFHLGRKERPAVGGHQGRSAEGSDTPAGAGPRRPANRSEGVPG